jgi:hypothetical protein
MPEHRKAPAGAAGLRQAAEGTRTLDLLHGKRSGLQPFLAVQPKAIAPRREIRLSGTVPFGLGSEGRSLPNGEQS